MMPTHLIGKHLPLAPGREMSAPCCMCGWKGEGLPRKQVLSDGFMDASYLSSDPEICIYCAACIGYGQGKSDALRNFSFFATEREFTRLRRDQLWSHLWYPPHEPWVTGVTYAHKKHISFKTIVNLPGENYTIGTENGPVAVRMGDLYELTELMQRWYSICKPTAAQPTWFTKDDIAHGCTNLKRIEEYGAMDYMRENAVIAKHRNTAVMELLCHALNKGQLSHREPAGVGTTGFFPERKPELKVQEAPKPQQPQQLLMFGGKK